MPSIVTSRQNARVRELRAALRGDVQEGMAAVEGWHLVEEAATAERSGNGLRLQTLFLREGSERAISHAAADLEVITVSRDAFDSAASTQQSQGIAAMFYKPKHIYTPAKNDLLLVAAGLQDPGNFGTLVRSAEALGAAAVLLAENTVDPWNSKVLRASAGSVFRMPLPRLSYVLLEGLRACGIRLWAAVPSGEGAISAVTANLRTGCAFLIGNEGNGLSPAMLDLCDARITLPMPGPTESLNAAVAGSLLLYEAARQRTSEE